jgi:hypothetical protein
VGQPFPTPFVPATARAYGGLANSGVLPAEGWWDDHAFRHEVARAKKG